MISSNTPSKLCENMTGQAHRVTEISHIGDRRRVDGRAIWSPVSWIYRTHRVTMTAVTWICCSRPRVYHTQQRMATGERVPGLQNFSRPTHRFFVVRKSRRFAHARPERSHREKSCCTSHGRSTGTPSSYHQSFIKIRGDGAEIEPRVGGSFTYFAKGRDELGKATYH